MNDKKIKAVSAQVILQPESGEQVDSETLVTAENVHLFLPSPEDLSRAQNYFVDMGFEVQEGFGNSFAITGSKKLFQKTFNTKIVRAKNKNIKALQDDETESSELPMDDMSKEIKDVVAAVTFTEEPDFGPSNF